MIKLKLLYEQYNTATDRASFITRLSNQKVISQSAFSGKIETTYNYDGHPYKYFGKYATVRDDKADGKIYFVPAGEGILYNLTDGSVQKGEFHLGMLVNGKKAEVRQKEGSYIYATRINGKWNDKQGFYKNPKGVEFKGEFKNNLFIYNGGAYTLDQLNQCGNIQDLSYLKPSNSTNTSTAPHNRSGNWYVYPNDKTYIYQLRGETWYAKNIKTNQEFNISDDPRFKASIDRLIQANASKTLKVYNKK